VLRNMAHTTELSIKEESVPPQAIPAASQPGRATTACKSGTHNTRAMLCSLWALASNDPG
jgi:hypothetical protein